MEHFISDADVSKSHPVLFNVVWCGAQHPDIFLTKTATNSIKVNLSCLANLQDKLGITNSRLVGQGN